MKQITDCAEWAIFDGGPGVVRVWLPWPNHPVEDSEGEQAT
jgi:hypothetical protein